jgi:hypothetical protein
VPVPERGPIAGLQVTILEQLGAYEDGFGLRDLDRCACLALVRVTDEAERLMGLAYLEPARVPEAGFLLLFWSRPETPLEARQALVHACDAFAREMGWKKLVAYTRLPHRQVAKWEAKYGFRRTGLVEIRRTVES